MSKYVWECLQYGSNGDAVAHITVAMPQIRTDRRKVCLQPFLLHFFQLLAFVCCWRSAIRGCLTLPNSQ